MIYLEGWDTYSYNMPESRKTSSLFLVSKKVRPGKCRHDIRKSEISQIDGSISIQGLANWAKDTVVGIQVE